MDTLRACCSSNAHLSYVCLEVEPRRELNAHGFGSQISIQGVRRACHGLQLARAGTSKSFGQRNAVHCRSGRTHRMLAMCQVAAAGREALAGRMVQWLQGKGFPDQAVTLKEFGDEGLGCAAAVPLKPGDVALRIPENYTVTSVDVSGHPVVSSLAAGRGDLIGLTLWYMYERSQAEASAWHSFLSVFPDSTLSPLLWTTEEQDKLLAGSPVLAMVNVGSLKFPAEVKQRIQALEGEYAELRGSFQKDSQAFPEAHFSLEAFKSAFSVVSSRAVYLPTADVLALIPYADALNHKGNCTAYLDFSIEDQAVVLRVDRTYKVGDQVFVSYGQNRPNSDFLISYGFVDEANSNDYVEFEVGLVAADGLRPLKQQILEAVGLGVTQKFPLFLDRFPTQLLTYTRLVRVQDPGLFAKIVFEKDLIVDQANEYEVLMLLMADCRSKLAGYERGVDDEIRLLKGKLSPKEKVAAQLRLCEQRIYTNTMGALRNRLAPIRGIPTKGGSLKDPNSDINEMFDMVEQVAAAPAKLFSKLFGR